MKLAVVGCEASGKTVFMCALADYFGRDAANNPLRLKMTPENAAANSFERYQFRQMRCLRQWPTATPPERTIEMKWSLRRNGDPVATIDMLEFGGETFRAAFRNRGNAAQKEASVQELTKYLSDADFVIVLVSIKALLADPGKCTEAEFERETEALWVTRGILEFIRAKRAQTGVVIGLTQADKYRDELGEAGGAEPLFAAHWPAISAAAKGIPVVDIASVSKTDENGNPAEGYRSHGIMPVMRVFAQHCFGDENALENGACLKYRKPVNPDRVFHAILYATLGLAILLAIFTLGRALFPPPAEPVEPVVIEKTVTNTVEKLVREEVTNTVEKLVLKSVTNTVERLVLKPVTNTVEKLVREEVTNTVEKLVLKTITNTVPVIVERPVTNIVERMVTNTVIVAESPSDTANADENSPMITPSSYSYVPPEYRTWTDYNGHKINARWTGIKNDGSITLVTRNGRSIDAVLWKFSEGDQNYVKSEIQKHTARNEVMVDGKWVPNPALKKRRR